jgi:hypothetical protein
MTDTREWERRALMAVSALTVASGAGQVLMPQRTLEAMCTENDPTTRHLFGTVGMFMVAMGVTLLDGLLRRTEESWVVAWAAGQKAGAATAVSIGVRRGVFSPVALVVAAFDALSAVLALDYCRHMRRG